MGDCRARGEQPVRGVQGMIKVTVTFKDGTVDQWSTTLDYAVHLTGQLLIDPDVANVKLDRPE